MSWNKITGASPFEGWNRKFFLACAGIIWIWQAQSQHDLPILIDQYVQPLVETNNFSGNILISREHEIVFRKSYGLADRAAGIPITDQTVFQIASVSKAITAAAILRLQEQGKLDVHQPLSDFIPDYPRGDEITIHHLLTHTSGITNINDLPVYDSLEQVDNRPADLVHWFKNEPLEFTPGDKYGYSNSNYTLLAYIIEKLSGVSYGKFLVKEFFIPLQMNHTGHPGANENRTYQQTIGYEPVGIRDCQAARTIHWNVKTGNGSLYSTVDDLHTWASQFFSGRILHDSTVQKMVTPYADNMGYGWFIRPRHELKQYHINGRSPGYTSVISYYPDSALLIIILSNNYVPLPTDMSIDLAGLIFDKPFMPFLVGDGRTNPEQARVHCGTYQFGPDFYQPNASLTVSEKDGYLATGWGSLYYRGDNRYILRNYWSDVHFETDAQGKRTMVYDRFEGQKLD